MIALPMTHQAYLYPFRLVKGTQLYIEQDLLSAIPDSAAKVQLFVLYSSNLMWNHTNGRVLKEKL